MRAYLDADVIIWHLRGDQEAGVFIDRLYKDPEYELWIGAMQRAEIVFYMRAEEEEETIRFFSKLSTAPVDRSSVDTAGVFFRKWNPSHGIDMNDAILAGTVAETGGILFCLNTKHYPMPEVVVERAW